MLNVLKFLHEPGVFDSLLVHIVTRAVSVCSVVFVNTSSCCFVGILYCTLNMTLFVFLVFDISVSPWDWSIACATNVIAISFGNNQEVWRQRCSDQHPVQLSKPEERNDRSTKTFTISTFQYNIEFSNKIHILTLLFKTIISIIETTHHE